MVRSRVRIPPAGGGTAAASKPVRIKTLSLLQVDTTAIVSAFFPEVEFLVSIL
jgi:hypothetical protein